MIQPVPIVALIARKVNGDAGFSPARPELGGVMVVREATDKLIELVDEGVLDKDQVILGALNYMSEDDVKDMFRSEFEELYEETFGED